MLKFTIKNLIFNNIDDTLAKTAFIFPYFYLFLVINTLLFSKSRLPNPI
jgi:hypothetical protein